MSYMGVLNENIRQQAMVKMKNVKKYYCLKIHKNIKKIISKTDIPKN